MPIAVKTRKAMWEWATQYLGKIGGWTGKTGFIGLLIVNWLWKSMSKQIVLISRIYSGIPYQLPRKIDYNNNGLRTKSLAQKESQTTRSHLAFDSLTRLIII